ncbi:MAG TPA: methyltransferase domain-containing protein [Stellaceae bacterium]|nr:methyltransferase domain-containing protein [Stellaceae bacterium]
MKFDYQGSELALFATAVHWKSYVADTLRPFLGVRVLEVGAGFGANIPYLARGASRHWVALEPDPELAAAIKARVAAGALPSSCMVINGTIDELGADELFDSVLYIDVVEHIADDRGELARAARHLGHAGQLIVLAPAHQFLYSPFDAAIGHHRRYNLAALEALTPENCVVRAARMLDSVGFFASLANRLVLRSAAPQPGQIDFWDRWLVPLSRRIDPLTAFRFGKTAVIVWQRVA